MKKLTKEETLGVVQWCYSYCKDRVNYRDIKIELLENGLNENLADSVVWAYNNKKHSLTIKDLELWDNEKGLHYKHDKSVLLYDMLIVKLTNCPLRTHQKIEMWREACDMCGVNFTNNHCNGSWYSFEYTDENNIVHREEMSNIVDHLINKKWNLIHTKLIEKLIEELMKKSNLLFNVDYNYKQNTFNLYVTNYDTQVETSYIDKVLDEGDIKSLFNDLKNNKGEQC